MDTFSFFNYHTIINDVNYAVSSILDNDVRHMVHSSSDAFRAAFEHTKALNKAKAPQFTVIEGYWRITSPMSYLSLKIRSEWFAF